MLGRFLFRWRGVIGFVTFGVVFWLARPTIRSCLLGLPIILAGLTTRFWASGYIGIEGRVREIGASRRISSGPYRILRHPLYIGNFLLVAGMLIALRPAERMAVVVLAGFIGEYMLIVAAEEKDLAVKGKGESGNGKGAGEERELAGGRIQMSDVRCEMSEVRDGEEREATGEWRSERLEAGSESAEVQGGKERMAKGEGRIAIVGSRESGIESPESIVHGPQSSHSPQSFLLGRALVEWRTWVVTGVAMGLALVKAAAKS